MVTRITETLFRNYYENNSLLITIIDLSSTLKLDLILI